MSRFFIRQAHEADNDTLCELSTVPIEGNISLALERKPDFFAGARVQNEVVEVNLCCDSSRGDHIAAVFSTGRRREFVDGVATWVRYLSDLRVFPEYQRRFPLRMINDHIIERESSESSSLVQTVMFSDDHAMRGVTRRRRAKILRRLKYLWSYDLGTYRTSAISLTTRSRQHECKHHVRRGTPDDIAAMQEFFDNEAPRKQLYPRYCFDQLGDRHYQGLSVDDYFLAYDGGKLVGITGVWDQQEFKQTRIASYGRTLRWSRPVVNIISRVVTGFSLPPPGTELEYFYLHTIVTRGNSVAVFRDLVETIHATYRGSRYMYFLCGLLINDPLVGVLDGFRSRRDIMAQHYQVGINEFGRRLPPDMPMYIEAARL
jgi:hypothetical protein